MATQTLKSTALSKVLINEFATDTIVLATQAEVASAISSAVAGLWDWKGTAKSISVDGTKITLNDDSEVTAAAANKGYVYQVGDKEYASTGSKWEMLGFNLDLSGYVQKETGKSLVSDTEITKLAGIASGAQVNVIETVKVNGTALTVTSKAVDITVPTGALASKSEVAESDLASALATKINGKVDAVANHSLVADTEITKLSGVSTGANKVEASTNNGKIKIDGVETTVYTEAANTVHDANYAHITVTSTSVSDGTNTFSKYTLPSDVVQDSSYAHITVTSTSVSDGTTTFNKYDDTALANTVAGKAAKVAGAITALAQDYSIEDIATAVSSIITKLNLMNA